MVYGWEIYDENLNLMIYGVLFLDKRFDLFVFGVMEIVILVVE